MLYEKEYSTSVMSVWAIETGAQVEDLLPFIKAALPLPIWLHPRQFQEEDASLLPSFYVPWASKDSHLY